LCMGNIEPAFINLDADEPAAGVNGCGHCRARAHKRIEHEMAGLGMQSDKVQREVWVFWCWVLVRGRNDFPDLSRPNDILDSAGRVEPAACAAAFFAYQHRFV